MIVFDISHNEHDRLMAIFKELKSELQNEFEFVMHENYPLILDDLKKYSVFIILQPDHSHFNKSESKDILNYVENGGNLILLGDAGGDRAHLTNFSESILSNFGIKFNEDRIIDETKSVTQNNSIFSIEDLKKHSIFTDIVPIYSNGCSIKVFNQHARVLAQKDDKPLIIEIHVGLGNVLVIGSYMMFQITHNIKFFSNMINYLLGRFKIEEVKAPKFEFKMPEKLTVEYTEAKLKESETKKTDAISVTNEDFLKMINRTNEQIKKFSFHKDFNRVKKIKKNFSQFSDNLLQCINLPTKQISSDMKTQMLHSYESLYREFLDIEVIYEERKFIRSFQGLLSDFGVML
ncbi:MAG: hypothetical protein ACTSVY_11085, partial [Candidatus Helarchaeota archaeon]